MRDQRAAIEVCYSTACKEDIAFTFRVINVARVYDCPLVLDFLYDPSDKSLCALWRVVHCHEFVRSFGHCCSL